MDAKRAKKPPATPSPAVALDPALREILDHVARELAEEYVRLMEREASVASSRIDPEERKS